MASLLEKAYNPDVLSCLANLSSDEVFTPPEIANQILDLLPQDIWTNPEITFLDPACKSGVFLREIAKRLIVGLESEYPVLEERLDHIFKKQIFGIAITELTSLLSRRSLYCSKYPTSAYSVVQFDTPEGNVDFKRLNHTWMGGRCMYCGAAESEYERDSTLESYAYEFIHLDNVEEVFNMKFDVIVGNPPYQLSDGGAQASAKPIYQLFVQQAKKLNPRYMTMIMPARWYSGGKGLDQFRKEMIEDYRIAELHDYPITSECFPGVNIRGGICYFLWARDRDSDSKTTHVVTHQDGKEISIDRPMKYGDLEIFIRYGDALSILEKVMSLSSIGTMDSIVSARKPFGLGTSFSRTSDFKESPKGMRSPVKCYAKGMSVGYVEKADISAHLNWIDKWKVFAPRANNIGTELPDDNLNTFLGEPGSICTESYIAIGASEKLSEEAVKNLSTYLRTKFARFMQSLAKVSQDATSKTYRFVPVVDFGKSWTDEELYEYFNLSDEEIQFIEETIQSMPAC